MHGLRRCCAAEIQRHVELGGQAAEVQAIRSLARQFLDSICFGGRRVGEDIDVIAQFASQAVATRSASQDVVARSADQDVICRRSDEQVVAKRPHQQQGSSRQVGGVLTADRVIPAVRSDAELSRCRGRVEELICLREGSRQRHREHS